MVTRETEWDDRQRSRMQALAIYESGVHSCGWHTSLATDPAVDFQIVNEDDCQVCAARAKYERILSHADERVRKQIGDHPAAPDPADGRRWGFRLKSLPTD